LASRKRVKVSHDIQEEIRQLKTRGRTTGNREELEAGIRGPLPTSESPDKNNYWGNPVQNSVEADRFAKSDPSDSGYFIPLTYDPTKTSWPGNGYDHRRTVAAGYDRSRGILAVQFYTDNSVYEYGTDRPVPESIAYMFRLTQSPGRYINDVLNSYGYVKVS